MSKIIDLNSTNPPADSGYTLGKWQRSLTSNGIDPTSGYPYYDTSVELPNAGIAVVKTANYTATIADLGKLIVFNSSSAVTLTLPSSIPLNVLPTPTTETRWKIAVQNIGAGVLTISRNGLTIDGAAANLTLSQATGLEIFTDGSNYFTERGAAPAYTSPLTTKGDLFGHSTVDARIPVGTDGQVLTADSTQTLGVKWAAAAPSTVFSIVEVSLAPSSPGNFTVAHGLGVTPTSALIQMTSGGQVWFQSTRFDGTNLYLVASDAGVTGKVVVLYAASSALTVAEVALAPSSPGIFTVAHGLGVTPTSAAIQMTSGGQIWFQSPTRFDSTNLYLVASDAGVTGNAVLFH
jgi:hypothetical protein